MAQSIQIDIKGNAGSLLRAIRQSEAAMSRLAQSTNRLNGSRARGAATTGANTQATAQNTNAQNQNTNAQNQNTNAQNRNTNAQNQNANAQGNVINRLGQANAGFYNIAFAMEDAGQFANGFSAGMRAIGNNLSAIALSLSASGASFADFRRFLAGPGGLIIAISAFTALSQLVPAALDKIGSGADSAGGKIDDFGDSAETAGGKIFDFKEDIDALKSAFDEFIKIRDETVELEELDLVQARADLQRLERENKFYHDQRELAQAILDSRNATRASTLGLGSSLKLVQFSQEEISRFTALTKDSLEKIVADSNTELALLEAETQSLRDQIQLQEARELAQQRRIDGGHEIKEVEEDISATRGEILKTDERIAQGVEGLITLSYKALEVERIREQVSKRIENSLQRRAVFGRGKGLRTGFRFKGFETEAIRPEGGLRQAGAAPRFDFDPDEDAKRMESQMGQLQSATQAGMAGFTSAILSGEQSVGSAFGSFFAMMGDQLIRLGIANIGLGTAGEALRAFVSNPAVAIAAGAALIAIGGQLKKKTRRAQANITSGRGGSISTGSAFARDPFVTSSSASVGYIAPPPPPSNPYAEIRMDAKDFVVSFDDARRELDVVT